MRCFKCGSLLSDNNICPKCGADMYVYKRIAKASNAYYNRGLQKAQVRDLTGAVSDLSLAVSIDKYNVEARNLLGVVYCEIGEIVEGLSQWVISKNIRPQENVADSYIKRIQSNQNKFEMITGTIKKYNLSLKYAKEGNTDMAMIQLKKIVVQNPNLIKAQQLLALMYAKEGDYARAKKHLLNVLKIDKNNTLSLKYLEEIEIMLKNKKQEAQANSFLPKMKERPKEIKALNGNDVIIPKSSYKEPSNGAITILNVLIGVMIGAALIFFLVTPARYKGLTEDYNKSLQEYSEQLANGNVELNSLTSELDKVKKEKEELEKQINSSNGNVDKATLSLLSAANALIAKDDIKAAEYLTEIESGGLKEDAQIKLYATISEETFKKAANEFFNKAVVDYNKSSYDTAVTNFVRAYKCNESDVESAYYAAKCYEGLNQVDNAKKYFKYIVDKFASSPYVAEANKYISSHQ